MAVFMISEIQNKSHLHTEKLNFVIRTPECTKLE